MARSTFEGPILSGDNRFGALRDVVTLFWNKTAISTSPIPLWALPVTLVVLVNSFGATISPT